MGLEIRGYTISRYCLKSTPIYPFNIEYLVVAGGGAGGTYVNGQGLAAGGGAGGFRYGVLPVNTANVGGPLQVIVGAGGTGSPATNGSNSCVFHICSTGGGRGNCGNSPSSGNNGGSGGGAGGLGNTPPTSPAQGCPGGSGTGGGGGAGQPGTAGAPSNAYGGAGCVSSISGQDIYYAGGGGGGYASGLPCGGLGGGGQGDNGYGAASGSPNTGGGGGAGGFWGAGGTVYGCPGGSGLVIIRYAGPQRAIGGNTFKSGSNTVHIFTSSSNICFQSDFVL
jgi:hypothetical protein